MLRSFFITAFRHLVLHKSYSIINILGLATGIAACLIIFTLVRYELGYDKFQKNYTRIYHIITQDDYPEGTSYTSGIPFPALEALRGDLPTATLVPLYSSYGSQLMVLDPSGKAIVQKKFMEGAGLFFSEPQLFDIFTVKWIAGNAGALSQPGTLIMRESAAKKYFGSWQQAIGQQLKIDNNYVVTVSGIINDLPANTDFPFEFIASYSTYKTGNSRDYSTDWGSTTSNFQIYGLFPESQSEKTINEQLKNLSKKYYKDNGTHTRINLVRPLSEIHFDQRVNSLGFYITPRSTLRTLSLIALLIIIMACINFVNLSTAQSVNRSKEVGIRKVLGSYRFQLISQFMCETFLLTLFSSSLALLLAFLAAPHLKKIFPVPEELPVLTAEGLLFLFLVLILVTLLAGIYPALVMSRFNPVNAFRNKFSSAGFTGISMRRGLVVLQFAISQALIISTLVAISQMEFIKNADLGFNKEALLILDGSDNKEVIEKLPAFGQSLKQISGVKEVSFCSDVPSSESNWASNFAFNHKPDENFSVFQKFADENYFSTFGLQLLAGEHYRNADTARQIVINETLMRRLGIRNPEEAVGKSMRIGAGKWNSVCGVVKDFKTNSLREEIKPLAIYIYKPYYLRVAVKLNGANLNTIRTQVENKWNEFFPEYVFSGSYYDESIQRFYERESQLTFIYQIFAALAIFISCLGLYGLVSFIIHQRTKEVGIRKVLGAGTGSILILLSKEFTLLIAIAFLISAPVAWFTMNDWLQSFAYRIYPEIWVFVLALFISFTMAWIAVGYRSVRAALVKPVDCLRTE